MIARAKHPPAEAPPRTIRCAIYTRKSTEDGPACPATCCRWARPWLRARCDPNPQGASL